VPNGSADTATFGVSNTTRVNLSATTEVDGFVFTPGASAFTIDSDREYFGGTLTISGVGITNNSGSTQTFESSDEGLISFTNNATAGSLTAFTIYGLGGCNGGAGFASFSGTSSAGNGTFTNLAGTCSEAPGSSTSFFDSSTASNGTFINNCTQDQYNAGSTNFYDTSTAANASLIANGDDSCGGVIYFWGDATGGTARVELLNGNLIISGHNPPGVTIGSIEGTGFVLLGTNTLTVGSNNLNATFSGLIEDGLFGCCGPGSLTKIGRGRFILSGANTYTGGTTVERGELLVDNSSGSGTGTGALQVNAGRLGGTGTIAGAVTIGTGNGPRAVLAPGRRGGKKRTLTVQGALTFNSDATYNCAVQSKHATVYAVVANGVIINEARFALNDLNNALLTAGTVLTVIDNTATTPISGTFTNLPDGGTITVGNNTFQANYEGGDGNDLTLTVVQ